MIEDMKVLTAYVDKFQVYEHMLSRIQYQFEEVEEVDVDLLIQEMFTYIFADKDNVIINDKIRSLMYELPVRMTKTKFYEYIFDAMDIYNGTSIDGIDSFLYMVKSTAGLEGPADMKKKYPDIYEILEQFESVDYTTISKDEFEKLKELRNEILDELQERVNLLVQLQEIVNHVYVLILTKDYVSYLTEKPTKEMEQLCLMILQKRFSSQIPYQLFRFQLKVGEIQKEDSPYHVLECLYS